MSEKRTRFSAIFEELFGPPELLPEDPPERQRRLPRNTITSVTKLPAAFVQLRDGKLMVAIMVDIRATAFMDGELYRATGMAPLRSESHTVSFKLKGVWRREELEGATLVLRMSQEEPLVIRFVPREIRCTFTSQESWTEVDASQY